MAKTPTWQLLILWIIWAVRSYVAWVKYVFRRREPEYEGGLVAPTPPPPRPPMPPSVGENIQALLCQKHNEYMVSGKSSKERPVVELTIQQCFHLLNVTEVCSRDFNSIKALCNEDIKEFTFASVRVKIKEEA